MENTANKTVVEFIANTEKIELKSVSGAQLRGLKVDEKGQKIENYAEGLRSIGKASRQIESMTSVYVDDLLNHGYFDSGDRKSAEKFMLEACADVVKVLRNDDSKMAGKPWSLSAARGSDDCPWHDEARGIYAALKAWAARLAKMAEPEGDENDGTGEETGENETPATPADALAMIQNALKILGADADQTFKDEVLKIGGILPALQAKIAG